MDIETYRTLREKQQQEAPKYRDLCVQCLQPQFGCYCSYIKKFDPKIKFVILIHPIETKRRIATGRMAHLCLENSELIVGQDYTQNRQVNDILKNPQFQSLVLYPGRDSRNLTKADSHSKAKLFADDKTPVIFVIDGTWATAKKTMHLSQNLKSLPRICFTPPGPSQFRVRKQPGVECYSTIEAIHHSIELLGEVVGFDLKSGQQDSLTYVFQKMVERQLGFIQEAFDNPRSNSYRRPKNRVA